MPAKKKSPHDKAQARYTAAKKKAGEKRMCVWVPKHGVEDFKKAVARLRKKWERVT